MKPVANILKALVGGLFVFSALCKFVAIEQFEIYVYSLRLLSFNLTAIAARLVIVGEMVLGIALLANRYHRATTGLTMLMLLAFTCMLAVLALRGRTDSCHCFGELLPFNPMQSMLKNAVLLLLLLFVRQFASEEWQPRWWLLAVEPLLIVGLIVWFGLRGVLHVSVYNFHFLLAWAAILAVLGVLLGLRYRRVWLDVLVGITPLVALFVMSAPDNWFKKNEVPVNQAMAERMVALPDWQNYHVSEGRKIVGMFSPRCNYCRMAAAKLSNIQRRNGLEEEDFVFVYPGEQLPDLSAFYGETERADVVHTCISVDTFMHITYGQFPVLLLVDDGCLQTAYDYHSLSERVVVDFLKPAVSEYTTE